MAGPRKLGLGKASPKGVAPKPAATSKRMAANPKYTPITSTTRNAYAKSRKPVRAVPAENTRTYSKSHMAKLPTTTGTTGPTAATDTASNMSRRRLK